MNIGGTMKKSSSSYYFVCCLSVFAVLSAITAASGLVLSSSPSHAETSSVLASVTVPDVCTLSADSSSTAHTATVEVGTYTQGIGETILNVLCNDNNGYSIYAVGYSNNTVGNTNLIGTTGNIPTGTVDDGSVSNWAMKLTAVSGTFPATILNGYDNYHTVPSTAEKVATRTSSIDLSANSQVKTTYAVSISPSQAQDTYTGKVKYTVVHPNYSNADGTRETLDVPVNFAGQGVSSVTFTADGYPTRTVSTSGSTANLTAGVTYTATATIASGYEFVSWALNNANYGTLGSTSTSPTTFTPNANSASAVITATGQKQKTYMQNLTSSTIATLLPSVGSTATVYDSRDENSYTIAKLADNKYWMVSDLNLAGGTALSADNTDVTSTYISGFATSNNLTKTDGTIVLPASSSSTSGFNANNYSYVHNTGITTNTCTSPGCYSYYSWDAATLGSGRSISTDNTDAPYSICPKGWRLPTSRTTSATNWQTTSDFYVLAHQYGLDSTTSTSESDNGFYTQAGLGTVPNFLLAGYYANGSFFGGGSYGLYWSATSGSSSTNARTLRFTSTNVNSAYNYARNYGFSVRCVFGG